MNLITRGVQDISKNTIYVWCILVVECTGGLNSLGTCAVTLFK